MKHVKNTEDTKSMYVQVNIYIYIQYLSYVESKRTTAEIQSVISTCQR